MGKLPYNKVKHRQSGLTLIEVLIALAIVAISFAALIKTIYSDTKNTQRLEEKILGHFVAMNTANAIRIGQIKISSTTSQLKGKTTLLDKNWQWQVKATPSPYPQTKQIDVKVTRAQQYITHLRTFRRADHDKK